MAKRGMAAICGAALAIVNLATNPCGAAWPQTSMGASTWPQTSMSTTFHMFGDSFFENIGVNFGFNIPAPSNRGRSAVVGLTSQGMLNPGGINFVQGGAGAALPPFGGFVPNEANTFG